MEKTLRQEDQEENLTPEEESVEEVEEEDEEAQHFEIFPNTMMEVVDLNNQLIFIGRVDSYKRGVLTVREASDQEVPPTIFNDEYRLRCFQGGVPLMLSGQICGSNRNLWRLDRLRKQFPTEQRNYFRQQVKRPCKAVLLKEPELDKNGRPLPVKEHPVPGELLDISAGGLLLKTKETFQEGDQLSIREVQILPNLPPFSFTCQVRSVRPERHFIRYGCQFQSMSTRDQDRLFQAIFDIQRQEIKAKRK